MKKALSLILALVMIVTCLSGVVFAEAPANAIASIVTGDAEPVYATTMAELVDAISPRGTSVVTLLKDVDTTTTASCWSIPVCKLDLNGFTMDGKGIYIDNAKTDDDADNLYAEVLNGTIHTTGTSAIYWNVGGLKVSGCTLISDGGSVVALNCTTAALEGKENIIENSTLYSKAYFATSFHTSTGDHSKVVVKIENTNLISAKTSQLLGKWKADAKGGTFVLGYNVNMYNTNTAATAAYVSAGNTVSGKTVEKDTNKHSITVYGDTLENLTRWYTEPLATVQTGDTTVNVATVADMVAAIDPKGTSTVTLYDDITLGSMTTLPVCTLDLNGHTWKTTAGNAIAIVDSNLTDNDNCYTVIKNGTIHGATSAIRHETGGLKISNCTLRADGSAAIQILDEVSKGNYNDGNIIENSTLDCTIWAALAYNRAKDFSALSYKIVNSNLIGSKPAGTEVLGKHGSATSGSYEMGENVNIYTYKTGDTDYVKTGCPVTGKTPTKLSGTYDVEVAGVIYTGLTRWTTETPVAPTANTPENGTVALSPAQAYSGETVTITATPAEGYELDTITVNGEPISGTTFVMPKNGASVEVTFKAVAGSEEPASDVRKPTYHGIKIEAVTGGTVKASAEKATINTVIDLEIVPEAGYVLESITVKKLYNGTNATVTDNSFYMPYSNVVITPVFKKAG